MGRSNQGNTCMHAYISAIVEWNNSKTEISLHVNDDLFLTCH